MLLQQVHKALLVGRPCTAHHFQLHHTVESLIVAQSGKVGTCYLSLGRCIGIPDAYLAGYLDSCGRCVAGYYLNGYTCVDTFLHGCGHVGTYRVAYGSHGLERKVSVGRKLGSVDVVAVAEHLICKRQCTHGLVLISRKALAYLIAARVVYVAELGDNLGRTLHEEHSLRAAFNYGCHILAFGRERQLMLYVVCLAQCLIVSLILLEPQQQGHFCRVTNALASFFVEMCGCVVCYGFVKQSSVVGIHCHVGHLHLVLRQRTRLVGAYHRNGAHCLAGMQLAHKVVVLEHAAHVESQAERNGHRHTLGHRHHDERNGHHEVFEHHLHHAEIVVRMPQVVRIGQYVAAEEYHKCSH